MKLYKIKPCNTIIGKVDICKDIDGDNEYYGYYDDLHKDEFDDNCYYVEDNDDKGDPSVHLSGRIRLYIFCTLNGMSMELLSGGIRISYYCIHLKEWSYDR